MVAVSTARAVPAAMSDEEGGMAAAAEPPMAAMVVPEITTTHRLRDPPGRMPAVRRIPRLSVPA